MPNLRRAAAGATLLLLAPLSACGGGGEDDAPAAPEESSSGDFCEGYHSLYESLVAATPAEGQQQQVAAVQALHEWVDRMREVGVPEEMPADAERGFTLILDTAGDLDEDASMQELQTLGSDLDQAQQDDAQAFAEWAEQECPSPVPSDAPTDRPSEAESQTTAP
jgi:hypothetical protein